MMFKKSFALALSALLFSNDVSADTGDAVQVLFSDIESNLMDYYSYLQANPSVSFPTEYIGIFTAMTTYTDDSYTTLFDAVDITAVESLITALPWYSTRLESAFEAALTEGETVTTATSSPAITSVVASTTLTSSAKISSAVSSASSAASQASSSSSATASSTTVSSIEEGGASKMNLHGGLVVLPLGLFAAALL